MLKRSNQEPASSVPDGKEASVWKTAGGCLASLALTLAGTFLAVLIARHFSLGTDLAQAWYITALIALLFLPFYGFADRIFRFARPHWLQLCLRMLFQLFLVGSVYLLHLALWGWYGTVPLLILSWGIIFWLSYRDNKSGRSQRMTFPTMTSAARVQESKSLQSATQPAPAPAPRPVAPHVQHATTAPPPPKPEYTLCTCNLVSAPQTCSCVSHTAVDLPHRPQVVYVPLDPPVPASAATPALQKTTVLTEAQATELLHSHRHIEEPPFPAGGTSPLTSAEADKVECTVFAPPHANPGTSLLVQVFAHCAEHLEAVQRIAREFDEDATQRGFRSLDRTIERGTKLGFHLEFPSLVVDEPLQHLQWSGNPESVQFGVTVPPGRRPGSVIGTVTISIASVPVGHIKFVLKITPEMVSDLAPVPAGDHVHAYSKAFISYASSDRAKVLARVQMLQAVGIDYFQDVVNLAPGDEWGSRIYEYIDKCDLFLLFWSSAARDSEWVMKEVRYALERRGGDEFKLPEIRPVIIEGPPIVPPPDELKYLHFNDSLTYLLAVEDQASRSK